MNNRPWVVANVLLLVVACLVLALLFDRPAVGVALEPPSVGPAAGPIGRFEMKIIDHGASTTTVFVMDTTSGQCWYRSTHHLDKTWTDMSSPVNAKPVEKK